jgi:TonB family protein
MSLFLFAPLLLAAAQPAAAPPMIRQAPPSPPAPSAPPASSPPPAPLESFPVIRAQPIDPHMWITTDDYPAAALRAEVEGTVVVRYRIDKAGKVHDCVVTESSGVPVLDDRTCLLLTRRGRFVPAVDARGRAVEDGRIQRIIWALPDDRSRPPFVSGFAAASVPVFSSEPGACALADSRPELRILAEDLCGELPSLLSAPDAPRPTRLLPRTLAIVTLEADGVALARPPQPSGEAIYAETATFEVAADGTVTQCRRQATLRWPGRPDFDLCRFLETLDRGYFEGAPIATAPARRGRMTVTFYALPRDIDMRSI